MPSEAVRDAAAVCLGLQPARRRRRVLSAGEKTPQWRCPVDLRAVARLVLSRAGEDPVDMDEILGEAGLRLSWEEKANLAASLEGIEAFYDAVSGKFMVRRVK